MMVIILFKHPKFMGGFSMKNVKYALVATVFCTGLQSLLLAKAEQETEKTTNQAAESSSSQRIKSNDTFYSIFEEIENTSKKLSALFDQALERFGDPFEEEFFKQSPKTKRSAQQGQFNLKVDTNDPSKLTVELCLPNGYKQEDLNISIERKAQKKTLEIKAKPIQKIASDNAKNEANEDAEPKETKSVVFSKHAETFSSRGYINYLLSYDNKNGLNVEVCMANLSPDIDLDKYVMTFNEEADGCVVKIEFPKKEGEKKTLRFKSQSDKSTK